MMKHESLISTSVRASKVAALCVAALLMLPHVVQAEDKAAPDVGAETIKIAVVDLNMLVAESAAGKSIRRQLDKQRNSYRTQIEKQESELSAMEKNLAAQQAKLSKEDFAKKRKEFQEKVMKAQRSVQERRAAFDKAYTKAMETLREHIVKIVANMASKNKVSLVLNRQDVVLVDSKLDFSKQVLQELNAKVTSIPVAVN